MDIYMRTLNTCRQILNEILAEIESTAGCKDALPTDTGAVGHNPIVLNTNSCLTQSKKRVSAPKRMANPFRSSFFLV